MEPNEQAGSDVIHFLRAHGMVDQANKLENAYRVNLTLFFTQDARCIEIKKQVAKLTTCDDAVLIQGETGTGKELVARALHGVRSGPFMAINCAGMPRELLESELFGHAAGSFTGAKGDKKGLIAVANGGTIFLDEIGDLPLDMQAKLLRVIQEKTVRPVGANVEESITTRFIAASHYMLKDLVKSGAFRKDLYARLSTFELVIPPLRERLADIPLIVKEFDSAGKFPTNKIDWSKVNLDLNVRTIQQIVRRFQVLGELPKLDNT